jgi:hypothetical protein
MISRLLGKRGAAVLLLVLLVSMPATAGVADILTLLNTIVSTLRGGIGSVLSKIQTIRNTERSLQQELVWPVTAINQAKASVVQVRSQFSTLAGRIQSLQVASATLPNPKQCESLLRSEQSSNASAMQVSFNRLYGSVPAPTDASLPQRNLADVDDAMAAGSLKTAVISDQASQQMLGVADQLERQAGTTSPGSAPLLSAQAAVASLENQAYLQKMLAAQLREDAARLAHQNALLKQNAQANRLLRNGVQQMLTRP